MNDWIIAGALLVLGLIPLLRGRSGLPLRVWLPLIYLGLLVVNLAYYESIRTSIHGGTEMTGIVLLPLALPWVFAFSALYQSVFPESIARTHEVAQAMIQGGHPLFREDWVPLAMSYAVNLVLCYAFGRWLDVTRRKPIAPLDS